MNKEESMKDFAKIILIVMASLIAGGWLNECGHPTRTSDKGATKQDTIRVSVRDTITETEPTETKTAIVGSITRRIPIRNDTADNKATENISSHAVGHLSGPTSGNIAIKNISDSAAEVEIPITQVEYADSNYRAWVSGYEPRLDSLHIYAERETVTIRERPGKNKRWGIGLYVGYGMTPKGFQPSAGISIVYNLWNF